MNTTDFQVNRNKNTNSSCFLGTLPSAQLAASISISQKSRSDCDQSGKPIYLYLQSFAPRTCYHWRFHFINPSWLCVMFTLADYEGAIGYQVSRHAGGHQYSHLSQSSLVLDKRKPTEQISEYSLGHCFHNHQGFLLCLWSTKLSSWEFRRGCCRANSSLKWK